MQSFETWAEGDLEAIEALLDGPSDTCGFLSRALEIAYRFEHVRKRGDAALRELSAGSLPPEAPFEVEVPAQTHDSSWTADEGLVLAENRIRDFYQNQSVSSWFDSTEECRVVGQKHTPLDRIAISLPADCRFQAGPALLLGVPARIAGVGETFINLPLGAPEAERERVVRVARLLGDGVRLFQLPEDLAIFAFAAGTPTIPRVDRIFGLASGQGAPAGLVVSRHVGISLAELSTRVAYLADTSVDPRDLAMHMMARAEAYSHNLLAVITPSMLIANQVTESVTRIRRETRHQSGSVVANLGDSGCVITCRDMGEALALINAHPPEELFLQVEDPWGLLPRIHGSGSIRFGRLTPSPVDWIDPMVNGRLPLGGPPRSSSPPDLRSFFRTSSLVYTTGPVQPSLLHAAADLCASGELPLGQKSINLTESTDPGSRRPGGGGAGG